MPDSRRPHSPRSKPASVIVRWEMLDDFMPHGYTFFFNTTLLILSVTYAEGGEGRNYDQAQFTGIETALLQELVKWHPDYTPDENMVAAFRNPSYTDDDIAAIREELEDAMDRGLYDTMLRALRNVLSRIRLKLRPFGIEIGRVHETGYQLFALRKARTDDDKRVLDLLATAMEG